MKRLTGDILSNKKLLIFLMVVLMIACFYQGCSRYYSGNIELDSKLFNEENLEYIAQNWKYLVDAGFMEIAVDTHLMRFGSEDYAITCSTAETEVFEGKVAFFFSFWEDGIPLNKEKHTFATYERIGVSPYWWGLGKWGGGLPCLVKISYCSEHVCFQGWWTDSDGTASALNELMEEALLILSENRSFE